MSEQDEKWVSELLGALPPPRMPDEVFQRIEAAIAEESGHNDDELAARRRMRGTSTQRWALVSAAAAAVAVAVVVPLSSTSHKSTSNATTSDSAGFASSEKRPAPDHAFADGAAFTATSLGDTVHRLLAPVPESAAIAAPDAASGSVPQARSGVNPYAATGGTSNGSAGGSLSGSTGAGSAVGAPMQPGFSPSTTSANPDESCVSVLVGSGSVVATDLGSWNDEPAYLIVIDDPSYPDTYTADVVGTDCTGDHLHLLYSEKVSKS